MRARALRAPVFLSSLPLQTRRCAPPPRPLQLRCFLLDLQIYKIYKVLTYEEYKAVSGVFQNIDPPPPFHSATVSSPAGKCDHLILLFISLLILLFLSLLILLVLYSASSYSYLLMFKLMVVLQTCVLNTHLAKVHT